MNVVLLEFNFTDFCICYIVTMHCQNVRVAFNFADTVHTRNSQNKSHTKFKVFTVFGFYFIVLFHDFIDYLSSVAC